MLGTPTRRGLVVAGTLLATAATAAYADGTGTGADLWQGKLSKTSSVTIVRADGGKATTASISYQCKDAEGTVNSFVAQLTGKTKGTKFKAKGTAYNSLGTASIKATLKTSGAKGKVKVDYSDFAADCTFSKHFTAKYSHATGG
jgi:hypothetical protein